MIVCSLRYFQVGEIHKGETVLITGKKRYLPLPTHLRDPVLLKTANDRIVAFVINRL